MASRTLGRFSGGVFSGSRLFDCGCLCHRRRIPRRVISTDGGTTVRVVGGVLSGLPGQARLGRLGSGMFGGCMTGVEGDFRGAYTRLNVKLSSGNRVSLGSGNAVGGLGHFMFFSEFGRGTRRRKIRGTLLRFFSLSDTKFGGLPLFLSGVGDGLRDVTGDCFGAGVAERLVDN